MVKKIVKKQQAANPTLHGLLIARSFSGTVVRTLLFVLLTAAVVLLAGVASMTTDGGASSLAGIAALVTVSLLYLIFDVAYVLMSNVRPLHPRVDRVVLPLSLIFALVVVYTPIFLTDQKAGFIEGFWLSGAFALLCILAVRFGIMLTSFKRD